MVIINLKSTFIATSESVGKAIKNDTDSYTNH